MTVDHHPAKYGSRGETTLRIPIPLLDRLLVVASFERLKMKEWILVRVEEKEQEYGIVPPCNKDKQELADLLVGMRCDETPEELFARALDLGVIPDIVYRGNDDVWHRDD